MRSTRRRGVALPLTDVRRRDRLHNSVRSERLLQGVKSTYAVIRALGGLSERTPDVRHRFDSYDTLDGEICLVGQRSGKIIRADLIRRDQCVRD